VLAAVPNPACRRRAAYITLKLAFSPAQAAISSWSYAVMGAIFALSTPLGIAIGLGVQSTYNEHSPTALAVEGIFDSISAGATGARVRRGAGVATLVGRAIVLSEGSRTLMHFVRKMGSLRRACFCTGSHCGHGHAVSSYIHGLQRAVCVVVPLQRGPGASCRAVRRSG